MLFSELIESMEVRVGRERLRSDLIEEAFESRRSPIINVLQTGDSKGLVGVVPSRSLRYWCNSARDSLSSCDYMKS